MVGERLDQPSFKAHFRSDSIEALDKEGNVIVDFFINHFIVESDSLEKKSSRCRRGRELLERFLLILERSKITIADVTHCTSTVEPRKVLAVIGEVSEILFERFAFFAEFGVGSNTLSFRHDDLRNTLEVSFDVSEENIEHFLVVSSSIREDFPQVSIGLTRMLLVTTTKIIDITSPGVELCVDIIIIVVEILSELPANSTIFNLCKNRGRDLLKLNNRSRSCVS